VERLLRYLDDLDDLVGSLGLLWESLRRTLHELATFLIVTAATSGGAALALMHPHIALATSTILFVILLYRQVTAPTLKLFV
jgi:hypothetical protein